MTRQRPPRRGPWAKQLSVETLRSRPASPGPAPGSRSSRPACCVRCRQEVVVGDTSQMVGRRHFRGMGRWLVLGLDYMPHQCSPEQAAVPAYEQTDPPAAAGRTGAIKCQAATT